MILIINRHRRDETAVIDEYSRIRWEDPDGRYVEVYQDEHGQLMVATDEAMVVEMRSSNRCILVPVTYDGRPTHERLGPTPKGEQAG